MPNQSPFTQPPQGTRSEKIAKVVKTGATAVSIFSLIKIIGFAIFLIILALILMAIGIPKYIGIPMIIIAIGLVILQTVRVKRISSAKL